MDWFDRDLSDWAGQRNNIDIEPENVPAIPTHGPTDLDSSHLPWSTSTSIDDIGFNELDWSDLADMVDFDRVEKDWPQMTESILPSAHPLSLENETVIVQNVGRGRYTNYTPINYENDFGDVPEWLNGAYRPLAACTYCRQHRLQCLVIRTSEVNPNPLLSCTSCVALFRECSLSRGEKRQPSEFETMSPVYGHLHGVTEERPDGVEMITESSYTKPNPVTLENYTDKSPSRRPSFSRKGGRVLRNWFQLHQHHPYPTDEEKTLLAYDSGLTRRQVLTWFANARRRHKQRAMSSMSSPALRSGSPRPAPGGFALMTPMERWKSSPPEHEAIPESAIRDAITAVQFDSLTDRPPTLSDDMVIGDMDDVHLQHRIEDAASSSQLGSSVSSFGTRLSRESWDSVSSAWSYRSGEMNLPFPLLADSARDNRISSHGNGRRRHYRRRRRTLVEEHRYQCTFCPFSSKKKHDWCRHEKSVHLSLESWICTPTVEVMRQIGQTQANGSQPAPDCTLCGKPSPSVGHWADIHDFEICADRPLAERTFARKDHLWQHLQKFHHCRGGSIPPPLAKHLERLCRSERHEVRSRCGFCGCQLQTWGQRVDHLADHFKDGHRMNQWIGDWGLDGVVLQELRDAVLPRMRDHPFSEE